MPTREPDFRFCFGIFEVDARSGELRKAGSRIKLQDQPFKVLVALLERPGEVISREDLRNLIWPHESFGDFDHAVNVAVAKLRSTLDDSAETPRYVETLPKRGYRFIFPLKSAPGFPNGADASAPTAVEKSGGQDEGATTCLAGNGGAAAYANVAAAPARRRARVLTMALVGVAAVGAAIVVASRSWGPKGALPPSTHDLRITKVTNSGNVAYVAVSPDGHYLVYVLRDKAGLSLWIRVLGTQNDVQVLPSMPRDFRGVTFSPDGTHLFFPWSSKEDQFYRDLYSVPIVGGEPRLLIKDVDSPVSFSPDGRQILFVRKSSPRNTAEVRVANVDGSGERLLLTIEKAGAGWQNGGAWSPDGRTVVVSVVFSSEKEGTELDAISLADGSVRKIFSNSNSMGRPVWLPEGDAIVTEMEDKDNHSRIWLIPYPRGEPRPVTHDLEEYHEYIDGTRDGKTIAAIAWTTINNIFVFPAIDASQGKQITFGEQDIDSATVGPDGRILIHESGNPNGELWAINPDGSQRVLFSSLRGINFVIRCGSYVVYSAKQDEATRLIRTDADGLNQRTLASGGIWSPSCSSSGEYVYYADWVARPQRLLRLPIEGGAPVEVAQVPGKALIGTVATSPDGKFLAFPYQQGENAAHSTLLVIPAQGGPPVKRFPDVMGAVRWSPSGRSLVHYALREGTAQLVEQPLTGGAPRQMTRFPSGRSEAFDWSPDGKWLYIAHGDVRSDAVLIRNFR